METARAQDLAERLHASDREDDGTPLLHHIRRVAGLATPEARPVAWLHEALGWTAVTEQELLLEGLDDDELRALRLLHMTTVPRTARAYLAHLELVARSAGESGRLARLVKIGDLRDRLAHPLAGNDGWSPPRARGLALLLAKADAGAHATASRASGEAAS